MAISFPSPCSFPASSAACPPAPKVASTIVSPGCGSRRDTTSSARTGTWSVSVGKTLGNIFRAPFDLVQLLAPRLPVPDLQVVVDARHGDFAGDPGPLEERLRDHQPALLVELAVGRAAEEVPAHLARGLGERVERLDPLRHSLP